MITSKFLEPRIINEITYYPEVGIVVDAFDDREIDGVPSWGMEFSFMNIRQSTGYRRSRTPLAQSDIANVLKALGAESFEGLKGLAVIALHVGGYSGTIAGVANLVCQEDVAIFSY